jgi:hypothetical protein
MLGQSLNQRHHASFSVEPSISSKLLLQWLYTFDNSTDSEVVISFRAVKCTDNQIYNAKMEHLLRWLLDSYSVFFFLHTFHQFLSVSILTSHDVRHTEISEYDSGDLKQIVHLPSYEWLVVPNSVSVLIVLHEEHMGYVKLPCLMFAAELSRLSEDFFNLRVVAFVPIHFGLHHQNWDIEVESRVILLEGDSDLLGVSCNSCILDRLCFLS